MSKFGSVQVGYGFECEKKNGKCYAGQIVKVAAYSRGTLVTICYYEPEAYGTVSGDWVEGSSPIHKSIYLEDCVEWYTEELATY